MNKTMNSGMPTANLAINKSRMKIYTKKSELPTYYLQKGQEFQIELFNPTTDTILAKISLNGNKIGQTGLVLRPGERVFLDRYLDVQKRFKFDTYEVSNTSEVKEAIKNNGDFTVDFFKEYIAPPVYNPPFDNPWNTDTVYYNGDIGSNNNRMNLADGVTTNFHSTNLNDTFGTTNISGEVSNISSLSDDLMKGTLDFAPTTLSRNIAPEVAPEKRVKGGNPLKKRFKSKKSIETGRVEQGSASNQTMDIVYKDWLLTPFHTLEYKMLPESQKVNTVQDIQSKRYCTECGSKNKSAFKFCPNCGAKC